MAFLVSVGIQNALEEVACSLQAGEQLCAYFDDVVIQPDRVVTLFTVVGIRLHQGKTTAWNPGKSNSRRWGPGSGLNCGKRKASQCWAPPLDVRSSCWRRLRRGSRKNGGCGMLSLVC